MPKTRLITITKRVTEKQYLELDQLATEDNNHTVEEWLENIIDETVCGNVDDATWDEINQNNPDERNRFLTHAISVEE